MPMEQVMRTVQPTLKDEKFYDSEGMTMAMIRSEIGREMVT